MLQGKYAYVTVQTCEDALAYLDTHHMTTSAVLVDLRMASADNYAFINAITSDHRYDYIPILGLSDAPSQDEAADALQHGILDLVGATACPVVVQNRIANAIHIKDSMTFDEFSELVHVLPSNIFMKDSEGRYIFATHYWHHLDYSDDPNWTIRGKTDIEIRKDKDNAILAMQADKKILETGQGTRYTIEINTDGIKEFYDITKEPILDEHGKASGIIALIYDITEQELLKKKLHRASTIDGLTGLYNRTEIQRRIKEALCNLEESPFSLVMLDIDNFKVLNDTYGHRQGDYIIQCLANILLDGEKYGVNSLSAGRWGGEEFMLLLPGIQDPEASDVAERIRKCFSNLDYPEASPQTISLGVTEADSGDDLDTLYLRVDRALYEAKHAGKNVVRTILKGAK